MANFQVHQNDLAEKENPIIGGMTLKEKIMPHGLGATKQPFAVIGRQKENQKTTRPNLALRVSDNNGIVNLPQRIGGNKVGHCRIGKVKEDHGAATKMSSVVPVEQFKQFSVYEDRNGTVQSHSAKTSISTAQMEKENTSQTKQDQFNVKCDSMRNEYVEVLDSTPLVATELFSPMSIDDSHLSTSVSKLIDSNSIVASIINDKQSKAQHNRLIPCNDRQRFFGVAEYQRNILEYFRENEKKHRPKPQYMRRQSDINHTMRTILVDWLVEVSEEYNLDTETLYLAVSYIDRFLSQMSVVRSKLQLVGTAAMYIASKYEEIYPPDVGEFVFITDDTYTKAQVLRMEQIILKMLSFNMGPPTSYVFINTYAVILDLPENIKYLAMYISELALLDADPYLRFLPSQISSASLALARYLFVGVMWSPELEEVTTYFLTDLKELVLYLCKTHAGATKLSQQAIKDKYSKDKYKQVSGIEPIELTDKQFDELLEAYNEETGAHLVDNKWFSEGSAAVGTAKLSNFL